MTNGDDQRYWQRREAQERELAERASDPVIRAIHHDLAERYARERMVARGPVLAIVPQPAISRSA